MVNDGRGNSFALEEMNDKLRGTAEHPPFPERTGITTGRPGESDQVTINGMILFLGVVGLGGLAAVLGSIFVFAAFYATR
ncbi:MAG: hypothetical protein SFU56_06965 [Capsulimonadales bacterium]|nr:hypothetical protein [Capsulimonadales bacterium]